MNNLPDIRIDETVVKPKFDRSAHCAQIGAKGGRSTVDKYGIAHMREIAKVGFQRYADTHHDGCRAAAYNSIKKFGHVRSDY